MSEKAELETLFKNLTKGLKTHSTIKGLNEAIIPVIEGKKGEESKKKADVVIECVCSEFKIARKDLLHSTKRGAIQEARRIAVCLLHFKATLTVRYISQRVFGKDYHTFVTNAIKTHKTLNESLKPDMEYKEKYNTIETKIKLNK